MFDYKKALSSSSKLGWSISLPFRYAKYLLAETRPLEKKTINNFLEIICPIIDESADALGYSVEYGTPNVTVRNNKADSLGRGKEKQIINDKSSISTVDLVFQDKKDSAEKLSSVISIQNSIDGVECSYTSSTFDHAYCFRWPLALDFCVKEPTMRQLIGGYAKLATFINLADEEGYQLIKQTPEYKEVAPFIDRGPLRNRKTKSIRGKDFRPGD